MVKDYYRILGLQEGAGEEEVRSAFRSLVKQFHPDVNAEPGTHERFIEIQEAYEVLTDPERKAAFDLRRQARKISRDELERRERVYREWVWQQQELGRRRSKAQASQDTQSELSDNWTRVMRGVNLIYNLLFLLMFLGIIFIPMWKYAQELELPEEQQRSVVYFIIPTIAGLIFAVWGYYYWFILKHDET